MMSATLCPCRDAVPDDAVYALLPNRTTEPVDGFEHVRKIGTRELFELGIKLAAFASALR